MPLQAKFEINKITKLPELTGLFSCNNCANHQAGYTFPSIIFI